MRKFSILNKQKIVEKNTMQQSYNIQKSDKKDEGRARSGETDLFIPAFRRQRQKMRRRERRE